MADQPQDQQEHPPEKKITTRRSTLKSHETRDSAWSFLRRGHTGAEPKPKGGPVQDHVSCYDGLRWEDVRSYLQRKFPGENFRESKNDDRWTFVVPRKLTLEEKKSIHNLRGFFQNAGQGLSQRRPSVSDSE